MYYSGFSQNDPMNELKENYSIFLVLEYLFISEKHNFMFEGYQVSPPLSSTTNVNQNISGWTLVPLSSALVSEEGCVDDW